MNDAIQNIDFKKYKDGLVPAVVQDSSRLRQEFWTSFGRYMAPVVSSEHEKVNWINYKTGVKDLAFKMDADGKSAFIAIELTHNDPVIQQLFF